MRQMSGWMGLDSEAVGMVLILDLIRNPKTHQPPLSLGGKSAGLDCCVNVWPVADVCFVSIRIPSAPRVYSAERKDWQKSKGSKC